MDRYQRADRINARAIELADACGCRNARYHLPVAELQVDREIKGAQ